MPPLPDALLNALRKLSPFQPGGANEAPAAESLRHYSEGLALQAAGDLEAARDRYEKSIAKDPDNAKAHNNLGSVVHAAGDVRGAITHYERAIVLAPDLAEALRNLAIAWFERGDMHLAQQYCRRALESDAQGTEIRPLLANILYNAGVELEKNGRLEAAGQHYVDALKARPDFAEAALNAGAMFEMTEKPALALAHFERAIELRPDMALAHFNRGLQLLRAGDYSGGWDEYEWRWKLPEFATQRLPSPQPEWDGSALTGQKLLIYAEQGFGDAIQFARYATLAAERGAEVIVRCPSPLVALFRTVPGVSAVVSDEQQLPRFDLCCPLLNLARLFQTRRETIPSKVPYLFAEAEKTNVWREKLSSEEPGLRVGLVWESYSRSPELARRKSFPLQMFAPLARVAHTAFFSLQKGPAALEAEDPPEGMRLRQFTHELRDFSDTAALIANLDLVISIDSAVAHLAGAMGKPVWILAAFPLDWRWAPGRLDSPWYRTMRVFRQRRLFEWNDVISEVCEMLVACRSSLGQRGE